MQSRRFIGITVSALLLVAIIVLFVVPRSILRNDIKRIAISDPDAIDKIVISDVYDSTWLTRHGEEWLLFDKERVNAVTVQNLLFAAERLQINSIGADDHVSFEKSISYYDGGKVVGAYTFRTSQGQYHVKPAGFDRNFVVSIAGYAELDLDRVFSSSPNHFREHLIIDMLPSDILSIEVELSNGQAFRFSQSGNADISCTSMNEKTSLPSGNPDNISTRLLFSYFTAIRFEKRTGITVNEITSAGGDHRRMAKLHVVSRKGGEHTLEVYPYIAEPGGEAQLFQALVFHNGAHEALVVNYIYLDVLMRDLLHYFAR